MSASCSNCCELLRAGSCNALVANKTPLETHAHCVHHAQLPLEVAGLERLALIHVEWDAALADDHRFLGQRPVPGFDEIANLQVVVLLCALVAPVESLQREHALNNTRVRTFANPRLHASTYHCEPLHVNRKVSICPLEEDAQVVPVWRVHKVWWLELAGPLGRAELVWDGLGEHHLVGTRNVLDGFGPLHVEWQIEVDVPVELRQ